MTDPGIFQRLLMPEAAQPNNGPDPIPNVHYTAMSREDWETYLQEKLHQHNMLGVQKAVHALNQYQAQDIAPSTGQLLGAEAKGVAQFPGQALHGLASTLEQVGHGDIAGAARSTLSGLGKGIQGLTKLPAAAANLTGAALSGEATPDYSRDDLLGRAKGFGSSEAAIAALAAPGAISRFGKGASEGGVGAGLSAAVRGLPEPTGLVSGYQPTAGSVARATSDASATPRATSATPQPLTDAARGMTDEELAAQPHGQTPPLAQSMEAPGALDKAIGKLNPLGKPAPSGLPPFEESGPPGSGGLARSTAVGGAPASADASGLLGNEGGWTTSETMGMLGASGTRLGSGAGI